MLLVTCWSLQLQNLRSGSECYKYCARGAETSVSRAGGWPWESSVSAEGASPVFSAHIPASRPRSKLRLGT